MILLEILDALFLFDVAIWLFTSRIGRLFLVALIAAVIGAIAFGVSPLVALGIFTAAWITAIVEEARKDGKSFRRRPRSTA